MTREGIARQGVSLQRRDHKGSPHLTLLQDLEGRLERQRKIGASARHESIDEAFQQGAVDRVHRQELTTLRGGCRVELNHLREVCLGKRVDDPASAKHDTRHGFRTPFLLPRPP